MTPEQKQRIEHEISNWRNARNDHSAQLTGDRMAALLQELVDAHEPKPVARVTGYYAGYMSIATVDGRVLPAGTALYAAPTPAEAPADVARDAARYRWVKGMARKSEAYDRFTGYHWQIGFYDPKCVGFDSAIDAMIRGRAGVTP